MSIEILVGVVGVGVFTMVVIAGMLLFTSADPDA